MKSEDVQAATSSSAVDNLNIEEMKQIYIDEIDCLKVNLVATEELYKECLAQKNELLARNACMADEIGMLKAKVRLDG